MKRLTQETKNRIMELYNSGKGIYEIAKELGLTYAIVAYHVKPEFREKIKERNHQRYLAKKENKV
jgi:hypothetical protein